MTEPDLLAPTSPGAAVPEPDRAASGAPTPARRGIPWLKLLLALVAVAALVLAGRQLGGLVAEGTRRIAALGAWAPGAFVAAYTLATVAFVPGLVLTLAGGALFGVARGTVYVFAGAVLGSSAAFLIARYVARDAIERRIAHNARFRAIDRAIGREGRKIVFLLRLSPVFPFNLLNYALGLTRVRFADYLVASLGMLPGTLLYVYGGKVIGDVAAVASGVKPPAGVGAWALLGLGLVATAVVTAVITRAAKRALAEEVEHAGP
jgi:uncharacterized membrane protein YdjX (TVP38/TMEM64 family)